MSPTYSSCTSSRKIQSLWNFIHVQNRKVSQVHFTTNSFIIYHYFQTNRLLFWKYVCYKINKHYSENGTNQNYLAHPLSFTKSKQKEVRTRTLLNDVPMQMRFDFEIFSNGNHVIANGREESLSMGLTAVRRLHLPRGF